MSPTGFLLLFFGATTRFKFDGPRPPLPEAPPRDESSVAFARADAWANLSLAEISAILVVTVFDSRLVTLVTDATGTDARTR